MAVPGGLLLLAQDKNGIALFRQTGGRLERVVGLPPATDGMEALVVRDVAASADGGRVAMIVGGSYPVQPAALFTLDLATGNWRTVDLAAPDHPGAVDGMAIPQARPAPPQREPLAYLGDWCGQGWSAGREGQSALDPADLRKLAMVILKRQRVKRASPTYVPAGRREVPHGARAEPRCAPCAPVCRTSWF